MEEFKKEPDPGMELLAPAGSVETFYAALNGGADAVYVGAPEFNARNPARELRLEEIGAMILHCHKLDKKLYIAFNSLIHEREISRVIETLALLQELGPDALIVQDLGLIRLARSYFPDLKLHGSTLTTVHNSDGVRFQGELGCERVVLSRELTLKEIGTIASRRGKIELEIFIHGAMCFSYSGLCLFSSYLGGKSGLRGRCVQPCRRSYTSSPKDSKKRGKRVETGRYLFSMNDLNGLETVPTLREFGISSLKIEGRLRSAHYVESIVAAYRTVLDAEPGNEEGALLQAEELAGQAMSRKTSPGYFFSPQPPEAISPQHSGNMGIHLGRFTATRKVGNLVTCRFVTKADLAVDDRLRLHVEPSGERTAFRLKSLFAAGGAEQDVKAGTKVSIGLPESFAAGGSGHVEIYKVDGASTGEPLHGRLKDLSSVAKAIAGKRKKLARRIDDISANVCADSFDAAADSPDVIEKFKKRVQRRKLSKGRLPLECWLRTDSIKTLLGDLPFSPDRFLLNVDKHTVSQVGQIKSSLGKKSRMVSWALPPLIMENDLPRYRKQIDLLLRSGFRSFQLAHISQILLFEGEKAHLFSDYTVNVLNSQAVAMLSDMGVDSAQVSIEIDQVALRELLFGCKIVDRSSQGDRTTKNIPVGLTVYGAPPLYTSRLASNHLQYDRQLYSPRNEAYVIRKKEGFTQTYPEKPFSLLPYLENLKEMGLNYVVVDISGRPHSKRESAELVERLQNTGRYSKLPTFNFLGTLA
ncbi:MAG: peptidase U32 family protein [Desulforhopalus sp.]